MCSPSCPKLQDSCLYIQVSGETPNPKLSPGRKSTFTAMSNIYSPTSGGRSIGIFRLRTEAMDFSLVLQLSSGCYVQHAEKWCWRAMWYDLHTTKEILKCLSDDQTFILWFSSGIKSDCAFLTHRPCCILRVYLPSWLSTCSRILSVSVHMLHNALIMTCGL
jgi:hypothetical protein